MEASVAVAAGNMDARSMRINTTSSTTSSSTTTASSVGHQHSRRNNNNHNNANASGMHISDSNILRSPYLSTLLEYTGIINRSISTSTSRPNNHSAADSNNINNQHNFASYYSHPQDHGPAGGEVSISIIEHDHSAPASSLNHSIPQPQNEDSFSRLSDSLLSSLESQQHLRDDFRTTDRRELPGTADTTDSASEGGDSFNHRDSSSSSYQRYDIQQAARWIEQVLPFTLLLLLVFVRQHLEGFCVTICIAGIMFKSNDIIRKQTALKAERIIFVLVGISVLLTLPVFWVYWWYSNDNLLYPLLMLPPKTIPPFWHAIFIIMVNDTLVRQAAMVIKCMVLIYYKNSKGRDYRRQGQMLTLVEYLLLLYRALLPAPVWYRFFLNKEYGSLFSSLMTGLYLTFKLTSVVEKVQSFITALKALSRKDIHYGAYATSEQVIAAGDLCAICQEKMHAPILLRCNHIFCEDCVSEWFERERTCPLCRAVVKPSDLKSYGDGSTNLFFQLF